MCTDNGNARWKVVKCLRNLNRARCYFQLEETVEVEPHVCAIPASTSLSSVRILILLSKVIFHYSQSLQYSGTNPTPKTMVST